MAPNAEEDLLVTMPRGPHSAKVIITAAAPSFWIALMEYAEFRFR